jgi:hypothetical protein
MRVEDSPRLQAMLKDLADAHDHKPISEAGLRHWFEALQPFPIHKVEAMAKQWIVAHSKFPTIADFYGPLNEEAIDAREATWNATKAQEKREAERFEKTELGSRILGKLKTFSVGKRDPKRWARDILDAWADNKPLQYTDPISGQKHVLEYEALVTISTGEKVSVMVPSMPDPHGIRLACEALDIDYKALMSVRNKEWRNLLQPRAPIPEPALEMREPGEE